MPSLIALRIRKDLHWPVRLLMVERFGKMRAGEGQFVEESWYDRFVGLANAAALIEAASFGDPLEAPRPGRGCVVGHHL